MSQQRTIAVDERPPLSQLLPLSFQHLFAMFGATVLVPFLTGLSPAVALLSSGVGTLLFILITKGQVPAYLGSSFAFIAPIIAVSATSGPGEAMFGIMMIGVVYAICSGIIFKFGVEWLRKLLPPVVVGSVIVVIGLGLATVAVDMATTEYIVVDKPATIEEFSALPGSVQDVQEDSVLLKVYSGTSVLVAFIALAVAIIASTFFRGFFAIIPVLLGIVSGYIAAIPLGLVNFQQVIDAPWFAIPEFTTPIPNTLALWVIVPVALVTIAEHLGDIFVTGKIVERDLLKKPGLHRTLLGDGVATFFASLVGGPPNTTYGENIGVLAITRVFSVFVIAGAAIMAIGMAFIGKVAALISTIPVPVMGGVSILLFGIIASSGLRMLVDSGIQYKHKRNLVISSVILILGVGNAILNFGLLELHGMALATIAGILLNAILPKAIEVDERPSTVEQ
ncbi:uracil permease [Desulfuribacillus alkaliarsenatis]|uniref:Uracil permease n=1 Tax=Desulfuribacillus alkaliarsenatis TaxID=766136 RepID=A0A1E5FZU4_9FIRM|nr:uracil permease [Desulfuribacillus alkaliarsenatis]OEF96050.1 uracil permease [Desulfuribacillus alkaliarsenatis]